MKFSVVMLAGFAGLRLVAAAPEMPTAFRADPSEVLAAAARTIAVRQKQNRGRSR